MPPCPEDRLLLNALRFLSLCAVCTLVPPGVTGLRAQAPPPLRIASEKEGLHEITADDLAPHWDLARIDPDFLVLERDGQEVAVNVRASRQGSLGRGDRILFFAPKCQDPHSKSVVHVLRLAKEPARFRVSPSPESVGPEPADEALRIVSVEENEVFEAFPTVRQDVVRGKDSLPNWYWKRIPAPPEKAGEKTPGECTATLLVTLMPEPRRSQPATLFLDLVGPPVPGISQKIAVNVNGKELPAVAWDTPLGFRAEIRVPAETLDRSNAIQVRNRSPVHQYDEPGNEVGGNRRNAILIDRVTLEFQSLLTGPGKPGDQIVYRLRGDAHPGTPASVTFRTLHQDGFLVFDATHRTLGPGRTVPLDAGKDLVVACTGPGGMLHPTAVEPLRKTSAHLPGPGADWVVVTTTRFKALLDPLVRHRKAQGLTPLVVEARELYDTFSHGRFDPAAIRAFVRAAHRNWKLKPRFLLLVGDADHDVDWVSAKETLPATLVPTDYNGASATDALYGDVDDDGVPDLAVGRIPARSPEALAALVDRSIALETKPEPGPWRRTLRFVAGEARFNPAVDALLENTLRNVLGKEIPAGYRASMTWANPRSPYYWPAPAFGEHVLEQINAGALAFTYVGHGLPQRFDTVRVGRERFPILDDRAAARVDCGRRNPVMAIIACWTGEYDRPDRDCIAETLLAQDRGPVAIIASSRISHPYPDALVGKGLAAAMFKPGTTVGEAFAAARAAMLKESKGALALLAKPFLSKAVDPDLLVRDHLYLYNLLGDPALRLPLPPESAALETLGPPRRGEALTVRGRAPGDEGGKLLLSLDRPIGRIAPGIEDVDPAAPDAEPRIVANHRRANNPSVAEASLDVDGGEWTASLVVPADLPAGTWHLSAYLIRASGRDAIGSLALTLE